MDALWSRLLRGGPALVLGEGVPWPPPRPDVRVVRVRAPDPSGLPPLEVALRALARSHPAGSSLVARSEARQAAHPRWRALQEDAHQGVLTDLHRLVSAGRAPVVVVVELTGEAPDPSVQVAFAALVSAASRPAFGLAVVVPDGAGEGVRRWVEAVREQLPDAVFEARRRELLGPAGLDEEVSRVVRALCVLGPAASSRGLAAVLGLPRVRVLELLQRAVDLGVPLHDAGEDELRVEPAFAESWRAQTLPSLAAAWQGAWRAWLDLRPAVASVPDDPPESMEQAGQQAEMQRLYTAFRTTAESDPARALEVAGALLRLCDEIGAPARAQRLALLGEVAGLQWARTGEGQLFTLAAALHTVDAALRELRDDDPPALVASLRGLAAGICQELGDPRSLDRALDELVAASRRWQEAAQPVEAARLLNDQACVWLASGDPVRAAALAKAAREAFETADPNDELVRWEAAETDLLLARLALRTPARGDLQEEAWRRARQHAQDAADGFGRLGDARRRERAREVAARLALAAGDVQRATAELSDVSRQQARLDDAVGLARTSEALALAALSQGQVGAALATLSDSITLNDRKGSPVGLAYDERALKAIVERADASRQQAVQVLAGRLEAAQGRWGRVELP